MKERIRLLNKKYSTSSEILLFAVGEIIVAALTVGVFFLLGRSGTVVFDYTVPLGALLGCLIIIINYLALAVSVNRAVNGFIERRGNKEMDDEEAEQFTKDNSKSIQNAIQLSSVIRTFSMVGALAVAFLTKLFNPIATVIPILAFRPIVYMTEIVRSRYNKTPNPDKFIRYPVEDEIEENNEKESD